MSISARAVCKTESIMEIRDGSTAAQELCKSVIFLSCNCFFFKQERDSCISQSCAKAYNKGGFPVLASSGILNIKQEISKNPWKEFGNVK